MKNNSKSFLIISILTVTTLGTILNAGGSLFLENYSGAPIYYQLNGKTDTMLGNSARAFIGTMSHKQDTSIQSLKIKASSKYSLHTSLINYVKKAKEYFFTEQFKGLGNKNAILVVEPSKIGWNIKTYWENDKSIKSNSSEDFSMQGDIKNILIMLKQYVQEQNYNETEKLINLYKNDLKIVFSAGQLTAIQAGSHFGADPHQKKSALTFIEQGMKKLQ